MPMPTSLGSTPNWRKPRRTQAGCIGSPVKPNGSMQPGLARGRRAGGETISAKIIPTAATAEAGGTIRELLRSAASTRIHLASTTCSATSPNGPKTAGTRGTIKLRTKEKPGCQGTALDALLVAGVGPENSG